MYVQRLQALLATCRCCKWSRTPHTPCNTVPVVPALEKGKLVGLLAAEEIPLVVRMVRDEILLSDIMGEDEVGCQVVSGGVDGAPIAVCQGAVIERAKKWPPNAE
jgi:hypothetical protein